jgi:hypothetical protein
MLSKSYTAVMKSTQRQQVLRALFGQSGNSNSKQVAVRAFSSCSYDQNASHSTLVKNQSLHVSKLILNKQLNYLHSPKVKSDLKASDDFFYRHIGNDPKNT